MKKTVKTVRFVKLTLNRPLHINEFGTKHTYRRGKVVYNGPELELEIKCGAYQLDDAVEYVCGQFVLLAGTFPVPLAYLTEKKYSIRTTVEYLNH